MKTMDSKALFSSQRHDWETPASLYAAIDKEFGFTLDACATNANHKCLRYFTPADDGLRQPWAGHRVFCNPPYGREIGRWVAKAHSEAAGGACLAVLLIPARTDTQYWHEYIFGHAEVRFLKGRVRFELGGVAQGAAPFPSAVVVFGQAIGRDGAACRSRRALSLRP